jgi:hypothetical protein
MGATGMTAVTASPAALIIAIHQHPLPQPLRLDPWSTCQPNVRMNTIQCRLVANPPRALARYNSDLMARQHEADGKVLQSCCWTAATPWPTQCRSPRS